MDSHRAKAAETEKEHSMNICGFQPKMQRNSGSAAKTVDVIMTFWL